MILLLLLIPILFLSLHAYLAARISLFHDDHRNRYPEFIRGFGKKIQCGTCTMEFDGSEEPLIVNRYIIHIYPTANKNGSRYVFYFQKNQPYLGGDDHKDCDFIISFPITWYFPPKYENTLR
jgi:hypothetical protein